MCPATTDGSSQGSKINTRAGRKPGSERLSASAATRPSRNWLTAPPTTQTTVFWAAMRKTSSYSSA